MGRTERAASLRRTIAEWRGCARRALGDTSAARELCARPSGFRGVKKAAGEQADGEGVWEDSCSGGLLCVSEGRPVECRISSRIHACRARAPCSFWV
jgi:hypothetical protein